MNDTVLPLVSALTVATLALGCAAAGAKDKTRGPAPGAPAPDFTLPSSEGGEVTLSALRGRPVVLYFYPKDQTPGCTKQACDLRDADAELKALGAVVLGVSRDSLKSHRAFAERHRLKFPLLSDENGTVHDLYGAFKPGSIFGRTALGVDRSTFLIGPDGTVRRVWRAVDVRGHAAEVLAAARELR